MRTFTVTVELTYTDIEARHLDHACELVEQWANRGDVPDRIRSYGVETVEEPNP